MNEQKSDCTEDDPIETECPDNWMDIKHYLDDNEGLLPVCDPESRWICKIKKDNTYLCSRLLSMNQCPRMLHKLLDLSGVLSKNDVELTRLRLILAEKYEIIKSLKESLSETNIDTTITKVCEHHHQTRVGMCLDGMTVLECNGCYALTKTNQKMTQTEIQYKFLHYGRLFFKCDKKQPGPVKYLHNVISDELMVYTAGFFNLEIVQFIKSLVEKKNDDNKSRLSDRGADKYDQCGNHHHKHNEDWICTRKTMGDVHDGPHECIGEDGNVITSWPNDIVGTVSEARNYSIVAIDLSEKPDCNLVMDFGDAKSPRFCCKLKGGTFLLYDGCDGENCILQRILNKSLEESYGIS